MATCSKAYILILLLTFQTSITTLYGQQFESDVLGEQGNITTDANYDLIKQMCNLLDTVELLRAAESSTHHQTVIEVSKALKSTMNNWLHWVSDTELSGEDNSETDQLTALCIRATAAVKATNPLY